MIINIKTNMNVNFKGSVD